LLAAVLVAAIVLVAAFAVECAPIIFKVVSALVTSAMGEAVLAVGDGNLGVAFGDSLSLGLTSCGLSELPAKPVETSTGAG
jgi:hypothetical protein